MKTKGVSLNLREASILDLGCGDALGVPAFFRETEFKKYLGIELKAEDDLSLHFQNLYSRYRGQVDPDSISPTDLDEHSFEERISVRHGTSIENFLASNREAFDLVVLSDLLHLNEMKNNWRTTLDAALRCLTPRGYVYIKVFIHRNDYGNHFTTAEQGDMRALLRNIHEAIIHHGEKIQFFGQSLIFE